MESGNLDVVVGSAFVVLPSQAARRAHVLNGSGSDIEVRQDGEGDAITVRAGTGLTFRGIENLDQLELQLVTAGSDVTVEIRWEQF